MRINISPEKLEAFEEMALEIARECSTHLKIEINFDREKKRAVAHIMLFDITADCRDYDSEETLKRRL